MRTIVSIILFTCSTANATETSTLISVERKGKRVTEFTELNKEGEEWICKTEQIPHYPLAEQPKLSGEIAALKKVSKVGSCEEIVKTKFLSKSKTRTITSCGSEEKTIIFLAKIGKLCGR